jgi:RNA polymerase sigma factor (TIGR02999 family)
MPDAPLPDPAADAHATVTRLLHAASDGDSDALDRLFPIVYDELRRLARVVRRGKAGQTLNTTALVHEAYLKLTPSRGMDWNDRKHFMRVAARAMRQVLVSAARKRTALKRGGGEVDVTFDEGLHGRAVRLDRFLALDDLLTQLEAVAPRQAKVVECRFFAGLTIPETADALDVSEATVNRDWRAARAWLAARLKDEDV